MTKAKNKKALKKKALHKIIRELDLIHKFAIDAAADSEIIMEKSVAMLTKLRERFEKML